VNHLEGLNERQAEAVLHTEGPLLIIAGAGAGKTKTLTHRILHLIKSGVAPKAILAITFTNKAGKEMRERVMHLLEAEGNMMDRWERPFVSTFHSLGVAIIRRWADKLGLTKNFTIFDRNDSKKAVRDALKELGYDIQQYDPNKVLGVISREKGAMVTVERFAETADRDFFRGMVRDVWMRYEAALKREKALDFDDLLLKTAVLLRDDAEVLAYYHDLWKYVHVDEYQDTNKVQYSIARALAAGNRHFCVVGDADQTIYTWRGATIDNILNFEKDYPDAKVVMLEQNYRSTKTILSAANAVIEKNKKRMKKKLFTEGADGDKITVYSAFDEVDEARWVADMTSGLIEQGMDPSSIAVLYRANYQSRAIEEQMLRRGVPYQVLGTRFFDRKEVKDVISYIRLALNPQSLSDLSRVANEPARGIGKVTLLKMLEGRDADLTGKIGESVRSFRRLMIKMEEVARTQKASDVVRFVMVEAGFEAALMKEGDDGQERLENIRELVSLALSYDFMPPSEGVEALISDAALATDQDDLDKPTVGAKLMTVHASKGLEFDAVFVTGMEQGVFPHEGFGDKRGAGRDDDEEERRLFYVAITRARKRLFLTHASMRTIFGNKDVHVPSQFLGDIDPVHIERDGDEEMMDADTKRRSVIKDIFIDF
jgi:DNA helicase-2/ATP-dependent DNA helicase PcrA